jgi:hypothetical protein
MQGFFHARSCRSGATFPTDHGKDKGDERRRPSLLEYVSHPMIAVPSTRRKITVPQLARLWGVANGKVLAWIHSGELPAVNLARNPHGRPRFAVDLDDVAAFERRRMAGPNGGQRAVPTPRRRPAGVKEFF